VSYYFFL